MQANIKDTVVTNANPKGCHQFLNSQWQRLNHFPPGKTYNSILVIGCSSGFGLATRLAALRNGAHSSVGVCYEKSPSENHSGSAGWHLNEAFHDLAKQQQHNSFTLNQDAFLTSTKTAVIQYIKSLQQTFDLVVYSVAAGIKIGANGAKIRSSILPIGSSLTGLQVDLHNHTFSELTLPPADAKQINDTVAVMGGDDWYDWMQALNKAGVLSSNCETYNYSYLGSDLNAAIYRQGTLGAAKDHMHSMATKLKTQGFNAHAVVCKALVTKASLFIPLMASYLMALKVELQKHDKDEDVFDQMRRLLAGDFKIDGELIRLDNFELDEQIQQGVKNRLIKMTVNNFKEVVDYVGIRNELLAMHGFGE